MGTLRFGGELALGSLSLSCTHLTPFAKAAGGFRETLNLNRSTEGVHWFIPRDARCLANRFRLNRVDDDINSHKIQHKRAFMSTDFTAAILKELSVSERKELIYQKALMIDATHIVDEELNKAYKLAKSLHPILNLYFQEQIEQYNQKKSIESENQNLLIISEIDKFKHDFMEWMQRDFELKKTKKFPKPSNLFELCGATFLITSNSVTRTLSTRMGHLWEKIANLSPYVIVPEKEFGISIKGIDIILYIDTTVNFAQLKTLKGTLTGSQTGRAIRELSIHDNPLFLVAFDLGSWTFPIRSDIPRIAGKYFWEKINIDYNIVENNVKNMLQEIDQAFANLVDS